MTALRRDRVPVKRPIKPLPLALLLTPACVAGWCYASTHDMAAGFRASANGGVPAWPPPRVPGAVSPLQPVVDVLPWVGAGGAAVLVLGVGWMVLRPGSFRRLVGRRSENVLRYRRKWDASMQLAGLTAKIDDKRHAPKLLKVRSDEWRDRVLVRMVNSMTTEDFLKKADGFAQDFGALDCRVVDDDRPRWMGGFGGGRVWLEFLRVDPLVAEIPALPIPGRVDLRSVQVGMDDYGKLWCVPALGAHILLGGMTGAGKSGLLWSLIRGLCPDIRSGVVQLWGSDAKGGMELGMGRELFTEFCRENPDELERMLAKLVKISQARAARFEGSHRKLVPSVDEPLYILVFDEFAATISLVQNRQQAGRIERYVGVLGTQGRGTGVHLLGAVQEPLKSVVSLRGQFSHRVGMRFIEPKYTDAILGEGARALGAKCDGPLCRRAGTAYVMVDGKAEPSRVRSAWVSDEEIRAMAVEYAPQKTVASRPAPQESVDESHEFALPVLQAVASEPQPEPAKATSGRHIAMTVAQEKLVKPMLAEWAAEGAKVRYVAVTVPLVPMSNNSDEMKNKFSKNRHKAELQAAIEGLLIGKDYPTPLPKVGRLTCVVTYRFGDKRQREVTNLDIFRKALGDALWRSKAPGVMGWLKHDADDEWTVLSEEIRRSAGFVGSTVRMWWREP